MHIFTLSKKVFIRWALGMTLFVLLTAPVAVSFDTQTVVLNCGDGCALSLSVPLPTFSLGETFAIFDTIGTYIGNLILTIAAFFTWVAGHILDAALQELVFGMGSLINDSGFGLAIDNVWIIIRDICNLAFIFGFIYLGILTILDPEKASVKRTLTQIIIGALLINFSLFIVKFVIDVSNLFSFHIYNAMISGTGSLSMKIFDMLGLVTFYNQGSGAASLANSTISGMVWYYIMGALLLFIAAFVFFAAAILLSVRFVALIFIMIASPVLFAATVFPQTAEYSKKLWRHLISYSLFAPLYLLLTLVTILLMGGLLPVLMPLGPNMSEVLTNSKSSTDAFSVFIAFLVMIFFLVESLLISKKLGIYGAERAIGVGNSIRGGVQSFAGRNTLGRLGEYTERKIRESRESSSKTRQVLGLIGSTTVGGAASAAAGAKWGGSQSRKDAKSENKERERAREKNTQIDSVMAKISAASSPVATPTHKIEMERAVAGASADQVLALATRLKDGPERDMFIENLSASQFDSLMKAKPEDLDDGKKAKLRKSRAELFSKKHNVNQTSTVGGATVNSGAGNIGKADGSDLDSMDFNVVLSHANHLSTKQIDDMRSLTPTAKATLKDARKRALIDEFNTGGPGAKASDIFGRFKSETEQAKLPREILTDFASAGYLTQGVLTKMLDNDSILPTDRSDIKRYVESAHMLNPTKAARFKSFFDDTPAGKQYI